MKQIYHAYFSLVTGRVSTRHNGSTITLRSAWSPFVFPPRLLLVLGHVPLRRDPVFMLLLLLGRRRLRSPHRIFRFRLRLATDMRDEAAGAHRGKGVS